VEVQVTWLTPPDQSGVYINDTGQPLTYRVYRAEGENGPWSLIGQVVGNSFIDVLPAGDTTQRYYAVMAYDAHARYSPLGKASQAQPLASGFSGKLFLPIVSR
jgi:hypothetical protein